MQEVLTVTNGVRLLLLPNEYEIGQQVGVRTAFRELQQEGSISEMREFSFLVDLARDGDANRSHRDLLHLCESFRPDLVFWQHPNGYPLNQDFLRDLKKTIGSGLLIYHEADPFDYLYKRVTNSEKELYRFSDIFLTSALGQQRELFSGIRQHPNFFFLPSAVDMERFATEPIVPRTDTEFDAIMIGSIAYRLRVIRHPGSKERVQLAQGLTKALGGRFATFGARWPQHTQCRGRVAYADQQALLRKSKLAVVWEHFPQNSFYFSDRLPISMASGTPFITSERPGYATLFAGAPGLYFARDVREAVDMTLYLRQQTEQWLCAEGQGARDWMLTHLEARPVFRNAFKMSMDVKTSRNLQGKG